MSSLKVQIKVETIKVWIYEGQADYQSQEMWKVHINVLLDDKTHVPRVQLQKQPPQPTSLHVLLIS